MYTIRSSDSQIPDANLSAKNKSHAHFVHALESALRILQPHSSSHPDGTQVHLGDDPTASDTSPSQSNRFNVLDIEIMNEDEDHAAQMSAEAAGTSVPNHSKAPFSGKPQPKAVLIDETDNEEVMFKIFCLFNDIHRLKIVLRAHWKQYRSGLINIETVALMTEMSITAVRNAERDLNADIGPDDPEDFGYVDLGLRLFDYLDYLIGVPPSDPVSDDTPLRDPYSVPELANIMELIFFPIYGMLKSLTMAIIPNQIPWYIPGGAGVYNRNADRSKMTPKEIMLHDRIILCELFTDTCAIEYANACDQFDDEFTKGIRKLYNPKSPNIPVWLVFATDCFLSAHEILGDDIERPFEELQKAALRADHSFTRFFEFREGLPNFPLWEGTTSNTQKLRDFQAGFIRSAILGDLVRELKIEYKNHFKNISDSIHLGPPNKFLKSRPILCGLLLLRLRTYFHDAGRKVAGAWGTVLYTSHAYNAFRQSGALGDVVWPEIESLISHYTPDKIFAGFLPTTPEQCFKSYNLLLGKSLRYFASNARRTKTPETGRPSHSRQGARDWAPKSAALEILTDWAQRNNPADSKIPDHSGRLLARLAAIDQVSVSPGQPRVLGIAGQITAFKAMMEGEMVCLKRDFVDLHLRCVDLLRALRRELDGDLTQLVGPDYIENENQLCMIVGHILAINSNTQKALEVLYKCKNRLPPNIRNLSCEKGARVMRQFILASPTFES